MWRLLAGWNLLSLLLFGAIVGWIASVIMGRSRRMGCLANIAIGILGALLAGFLVPLVFPRARFPVGFNLYSIGVAVLGAVILLGVTGWFSRRRRR